MNEIEKHEGLQVAAQSSGADHPADWAALLPPGALNYGTKYFHNS
jgi:hypothetical protein